MRRNNAITQFFKEEGQAPNLADMKSIFSQYAQVNNDSISVFTIEIESCVRFVRFDFGSRGKIEIDLTNFATGLTIRQKILTNAEDFFELKDKLISYILHGIRKVPELQAWGK